MRADIEQVKPQRGKKKKHNIFGIFFCSSFVFKPNTEALQQFRKGNALFCANICHYCLFIVRQRERHRLIYNCWTCLGLRGFISEKIRFTILCCANDFLFPLVEVLSRRSFRQIDFKSAWFLMTRWKSGGKKNKTFLLWDDETLNTWFDISERHISSLHYTLTLWKVKCVKV